MVFGDRPVNASTWQLAAFAAGLSYDDLPQEVLAHLKHILLDTLGTALAATTLGAGCREVVEVAANLGGNPESTIFGHPRKVAAPHAALANGALAHALNYDPTGPEIGHVGLVALTAPLAAAEAAGKVSGREFLVAATVAAEVTSRISAAQSRTGDVPSASFLAGQLFGYIGAAAGAGRILGLDAVAMRSAFGLALMQSAGTMQVVVGGDPPAKAVYGAFANHGGMLAALLSRAGLGADIDSLEGGAGLYAMFYGGRYQPGALIEDLGRTYLLTRALFKPWPTSAVIHPFIESADHLLKAGFHPSDIASVEIIGPSRIKPWCEPQAERCRPANPASAANSIQFAVAKVLFGGQLKLQDFTPDGIRDEDALALACKITPRFDDTIRGGRVRVHTTAGRSYEDHVEISLGHPSRPMTRPHLLQKFAECCSHARPTLAAADIDRLQQAILNLEEVEDVSTLTALAGRGHSRVQPLRATVS